MKKVFLISLMLSGYFSGDSQDLIKKIQDLTLANDSLQKQIIKPLRDTIFALRKDYIAEQRKIDTLKTNKSDSFKKIQTLLEDIAALNKKDVTIERDKLRNEVNSLNASTKTLNQIIQDNVRQIDEEKRHCLEVSKEEKEKGKKEILDKVFKNFQPEKFDSLIKSSSKFSIQRDLQLIDTDDKVKIILTDLESYFKAEELLAKKIDASLIKSTQSQLKLIKQQSALLDTLKINIEFYKDYNDNLKKTIVKLINLDKEKTAGDDPTIQHLKFDKIVLELSGYMYDYFDYQKYPYLSDIVLEIIKRKRQKADASLTDLIGKL